MRNKIIKSVLLAAMLAIAAVSASAYANDVRAADPGGTVTGSAVDVPAAKSGEPTVANILEKTTRIFAAVIISN